MGGFALLGMQALIRVQDLGLELRISEFWPLGCTGFMAFRDKLLGKGSEASGSQFEGSCHKRMVLVTAKL